MRALRIAGAMLAVRRIPVGARRGELRPLAAADAVNVDAVNAMRQPGRVERKVTPPAVCQARTVPIVWPFVPTSAIGAPPDGSGPVRAGGDEKREERERVYAW